MSKNPEPAVGQVWWIWGDTLFVIAEIEQSGKNILASDNLDEQVARFAMQETFADGQYLGTLDELLEWAAQRKEEEAPVKPKGVFLPPIIRGDPPADMGTFRREDIY